MRSFLYSALVLVGGSLPVVGCGSDSTPATLGGRLSITAPASGASLAKPANNKLTVTFDTNYVLKTPGGCGGQSGCGSVFLLIDGTACNQTGKAWNTFATASPIDVDLSLCSMALGSHSIQAELHQDDPAQSFVENSITHDPVTDKITITVTQ